VGRTSHGNPAKQRAAAGKTADFDQAASRFDQHAMPNSGTAIPTDLLAGTDETSATSPVEIAICQPCARFAWKKATVCSFS